jgi:hypothetical protein
LGIERKHLARSAATPGRQAKGVFTHAIWSILRLREQGLSLAKIGRELQGLQRP